MSKRKGDEDVTPTLVDGSRILLDFSIGRERVMILARVNPTVAARRKRPDVKLRIENILHQTGEGVHVPLGRWVEGDGGRRSGEKVGRFVCRGVERRTRQRATVNHIWRGRGRGRRGGIHVCPCRVRVVSGIKG